MSFLRQPYRPAPEPQRIDIGTQQFTNPVSDNDRGDEEVKGERRNDGPFGALRGLFGGLFGGPATPTLDAASEGEGQRQVDQTSLEELEKSGMLREYGEDAVLVVANGPEDLARLDHQAEAEGIAEAREGQETVVLWNPSPEAMEAMLQEGGFDDVVVSGHGAEGQLFMTGADGTAVAMDGEAVAEMFEGSGVDNVFLNVCDGASGGDQAVTEALAEVGVNSLGWTDKVNDEQAAEVAAEWASRTEDGSGLADLEATAAGTDGLEVAQGKPRWPFFPGLRRFGAGGRGGPQVA